MVRFSEQFQLKDLDRNAVSDLTGEWLYDRQKNGYDDFSLHGVSITQSSLLLTFMAAASYVVGHNVMNISVDGSEVNKKEYVSQLNFIDPAEFLGSSDDFQSFSQQEQKQLVADYIDQGMAQTHCTCPAYYYQGHWEGMASHDSDIYPFPGPSGTGKWRAKHSRGLTQNDITICKHIASIIEQMDNFVDDIFKELQTKTWGVSSATTAVKQVATGPTPETPADVAEERTADDPEPVLDTPSVQNNEPEAEVVEEEPIEEVPEEELVLPPTEEEPI